MPIFFTKKSCNRGVEPPPQMPLTVNKGLRIYGGGVYHPPFDTLKNGTSTNDIKLKLYR